MFSKLISSSSKAYTNFFVLAGNAVKFEFVPAEQLSSLLKVLGQMTATAAGE
jgi:hypothetical protein